jgi:hypothetical protein
MTVVSRRSRTKVLGSVAVAAGGFTIGGVAMALGLSVTDQPTGVQVVLQDAGTVAQPTTSPSDSAPTSGSPTPTASPSASSAAPATHRATSRRAVAAPRAVVSQSAPPVVSSTGS